MKLGILAKLMLAALIATALFATACGGDDDDTTDTGVEGFEAVDHCPNAPALELSVPKLSGAINGENGVIDAPGKVEFYSLTLDAPTFVRIGTASERALVTIEGEDYVFDPVVSVYNAAGTELLATSNNTFLFGPPDADAEVLYNAPAATTLCVAVEDITSWVDWSTEASNAEFTYQVNAAEVQKTNYFVVDNDDNDSIASAQELDMQTDFNMGTYRGTACGTFDSASDVDYYTIDHELNTDIIVNALIADVGPGASGEMASEGMGSTIANARISRLDNTGAYFSSVAYTDSQFMESPTPMAETTIYLSVEPVEGAALGDNPSYCVYFYFEPAALLWNQIEDTTVANDDMASATPLDFTSTGGDPFVLLQGEIESDGDVDFYSFEVASDNFPYALVCGSKFKGSGLIGATFEIQNNLGEVVRSETETDSLVVWNELSSATDTILTIPDAGTNYLVISAAAQDPDIAATYYTCRLQEYL